MPDRRLIGQEVPSSCATFPPAQAHDSLGKPCSHPSMLHGSPRKQGRVPAQCGAWYLGASAVRSRSLAGAPLPRLAKQPQAGHPQPHIHAPAFPGFSDSPPTPSPAGGCCPIQYHQNTRAQCHVDSDAAILTAGLHFPVGNMATHPPDSLFQRTPGIHTKDPAPQCLLLQPDHTCSYPGSTQNLPEPLCYQHWHSLVVLPDIWIMHLDSRLISRELNGRTRTATFTDAPAIVPARGGSC